MTQFIDKKSLENPLNLVLAMNNIRSIDSLR